MSVKILFVDDSEMTRNIIGAMIEDLGHDIEVAEDGSEALDLLNKDKFDILITDLNMPIMDGYTLIENVRKIKNYINIPILIITTEKESKDKEKGFEVGADYFLVKPVEKEQLSQYIQMCLDKN